MRAICSLHRPLPNDLIASSECAEELIIEVIAVCDHEDCWIAHLRMKYEFSGTEHHRQALACPLRMPNDTALLSTIRL